MSEPGLRTFLEAANENERDCVSEYADFVVFIDKIDGLFRTLMEGGLGGDPVAGMLFMNAHASFLAAARIAFSGQSPPTFMTLRGALESSLYALIASHSEKNRLVWINRVDDIERCRKVYTARNAIHLLKGDPHLCGIVEEAYELSIEFGAHPNFRSVVEHVTWSEESSKRNSVSLTYLHPIPSTLAMRPIAACVETGLIIILISPHMFSNHTAAKAAHARAADIRKEYDQFLIDHGYLGERDQEETKLPPQLN